MKNEVLRMKNGLTQLVCASRFLILFFLLFTPFTLKAQEVGDTAQRIYIPKDLPDCMLQLDSMLNLEDKAYIRENGAAAVHFSLGMWLRNNWGLWGGSRLQTYLLDNGINHPDDMSDFILNCYVKHLNGEELDYKHVKRMVRDKCRDDKKWRKQAIKRYKQQKKKEQRERKDET